MVILFGTELIHPSMSSVMYAVTRALDNFDD